MSLRSWCVLGALCAACYSPTLPLPPPSPPDESSAGTNLVALHGPKGSVLGGALVLVRNNDPQFNNMQQASVTIANSDGSWDVTVFAVRNDVLVIWQDTGNGEESSSIDFTVMVN